MQSTDVAGAVAEWMFVFLLAALVAIVWSALPIVLAFVGRLVVYNGKWLLHYCGVGPRPEKFGIS